MGNICKPVLAAAKRPISDGGSESGRNKQNSVEWFDEDVDDGANKCQRSSTPPVCSRGNDSPSSRGKIDPDTSPTSSTSLGTSTASSNAAAGRHSLHSEMTAQRRDRDVYKYYEVVSVLGVGSAGSVSMVRKRKKFLGGSARAWLHRDHNPYRFPVFNLHRLLHHKMAVAPSRTLSRNVSGSSVHSSSSHSVRSDRNYEMVYALKSIHLHRISDPSYLGELRNEIEILGSLDHPNIVRSIETFEYRRKLCLVMELCSGGDLYTRDPYTEKQAQVIVKDLLSAVAYMHSRGVIHRDIKFENILFETTARKAKVKLCDFGLSKQYLKESPYLYDGVGTIYTMAPQVLQGLYTSQADLWSVGVVAFMLLSSQMPFYGQKRNEVLAKIIQCRYSFRGTRFESISDEAKGLVSALLTVDPCLRPTADDALQFPWLAPDFFRRRREYHKSESSGCALLHSVLSIDESFRRYSRYGKLKRLALMVVAHKSTTDEIGTLRDTFRHYDKDMSGTISFDEFGMILGGLGYSDDTLRDMFESLDLDGSGYLDYTEFLAATLEANGAIVEERLAEAFDRLDCDDSGYISSEDLRTLLSDGFGGRNFSTSLIQEVINEADVDNDGQISYDDFLMLWEDMEQSEDIMLTGDN